MTDTLIVVCQTSDIDPNFLKVNSSVIEKNKSTFLKQLVNAADEIKNMFISYSMRESEGS